MRWNWPAAFCRQLLCNMWSSATRSPPKTHHVDTRSSSDGNADSVAKQLSAFKIQDGDQIHIFPIARTTRARFICKDMCCGRAVILIEKG